MKVTEFRNIYFTITRHRGISIAFDPAQFNLLQRQYFPNNSEIRVRIKGRDGNVMKLDFTGGYKFAPVGNVVRVQIVGNEQKEILSDLPAFRTRKAAIRLVGEDWCLFLPNKSEWQPALEKHRVAPPKKPAMIRTYPTPAPQALTEVTVQEPKALLMIGFDDREFTFNLPSNQAFAIALDLINQGYKSE